MAFFGFGSIAYFILLIINAIAILHKERFLAPLGLTTSSSSTSSSNHSPHQSSGGISPNYQTGFEQYGGGVGGNIGSGGGGGGGDEMSVKARAIMLVDAVRTLMRIPLIPINIVVIVYEIILG